MLSRFDANGSNVWSKLIGGTNSVSTGYNQLVSDVSGNVTLAGNMSGTVSFGGTNLSAPAGGGFIVQYDTNGVVHWAQTIPDYTYHLASGGGRLYVSLQSDNGSGVTNVSIGSLSNVTDRAWAVACLNATNGQALWLRGVGNQYGANYSGRINDMPLISVSGSNVFLTANAFGSSAEFGGLSVPLPGGRRQYFARYDTDGNPQAAISFGSPTTDIWAASANATGVYVCGDFDSYSQFGSDVIAAPVYAQNDLGPLYFTQPFIAKFDSNGNPLWARNGVSSDLANFRGIALASDGVWAAGFLKISNSIPAQFGTNQVSSDLQIINRYPFAVMVWNQAGMIVKIAETTAPAPVTLAQPSGQRRELPVPVPVAIRLQPQHPVPDEPRSRRLADQLHHRGRRHVEGCFRSALRLHSVQARLHPGFDALNRWRGKFTLFMDTRQQPLAPNHHSSSRRFRICLWALANASWLSSFWRTHRPLASAAPGR